MKFKVKVDRMVCISLASCSVMEPGIFKLDDNGKAILDPELQKNNPEVTSMEMKEEADESGNKHFVWYLDTTLDWINAKVIPGAQSCPVTAIHVWNAEDNSALYPA